MSSAAAFFLGDACLGLRALSASDDADSIASPQRREVVRTHLARASLWLPKRESLLHRIDEQAPNRLLFDALAFQACAALLSPGNERHARALARGFVDAALAMQAGDGHFIEAGGHDTSYQGVALRVGEDMLLASTDDDVAVLDSALSATASWLASRVDDDGRIDSTGNARTCWSDEQFLAEKKRVSVTDVFAGLAYSGTRSGNIMVSAAARRVQAWVQQNVGVDPCSRP